MLRLSSPLCLAGGDTKGLPLLVHATQGASAPRSGAQTRRAVSGDPCAEIVSPEPFKAFRGGG